MTNFIQFKSTNGLGRVAVQAYCLGIIFTFGIFSCFVFNSFKPYFIYLTLLSLFHMLEFILCAMYRPERLSASSFLIDHSSEYTFAFIGASLEFIVETFIFSFKQPNHSLFIVLGTIVTLFGQFFRSSSMVIAGSNFSHTVATKKADSHILVTHGVYSWVRHPSYCGFFWWSIGTQIILMNPISLCCFAFVIYRFFSNRIRNEEKYLIEFFGDNYIKYRALVRSGVPFIP